jgi:histidyl-tRNA synthetase
LIRAPKGMRDLLPPSTAVWNHAEEVARSIFKTFHLQEIRTPLLEETRLFARGVGEDTDIVTKEMYTFEDRDGSSLTLRPECTASVIRAYIEHRLDQQPGLQRLYYIGPMFRRERPQKGRFRQFYQIGAEVIGSDSALVDAEVIELVVIFFQRLGLEHFELLLNSVGCSACRPAYVSELRSKLEGVLDALSEDSRRRVTTNPLRVLDSKAPEDQPVIATLPSILDRLCEGCARHFEAVRGFLDAGEIAYRIEPRLVRGLDYYTRTTFEIVHGALGAQNSVMGGGRYDGLAELLGSRVPAPGIGFSIGEDRLVMTLEESGRNLPAPRLDVFVAPIGEAALVHGMRLARTLRRGGLAVETAPGWRLKKSMDLANKLGARHTLIVGDDEIAAGRFTLRAMASGEQRQLTEPELLAFLSDPNQN